MILVVVVISVFGGFALGMVFGPKLKAKFSN